MKIDYLTWYKNLEIELQGRRDVYRLVSSSMCEPKELMKRDIAEFASEFDRHYDPCTNVWGYPKLMDAIAQRFGFAPEGVVATNGVSNAIYLIARTMLTHDDHVICERPTYEPLLVASGVSGSLVTIIERRFPDFGVDPDELSKLLKPNTKLIFLSNLHNPSGRFLTRAELERLSDVVSDRCRDCRIVLDEIYQDFAGSNSTAACVISDRFITISGLTKVYGLGSIHCGWIVSDPELAERIHTIQTVVEGCGSKVTEALSAFILSRLDDYLERSLSVSDENRKAVREILGGLVQDGVLKGDVPEYGCIYFPRMSDSIDCERIVRDLVRQSRVYVVPGKYFGDRHHFRVGFGGGKGDVRSALEKLAEGLRRLVD